MKFTDIRDLQSEAWNIADENGFHEGQRSRAKVLALFHSEVSEALEADRENNDELYAEELADIIIRVFDHAESEGIDLCYRINQKNMLNSGREYRHGKEY